MGNHCCPQTIQPIRAPNYNKEVDPHEINIMSPPDHISETTLSPVHPHLSEEGTIILPDGSSYTGFLKGGVPHGRGKEIHEGGDEYVGEFVEGIKQGQGTYRYASGVVYKGQFKQGEMDGTGIIQWPNGDYYQGSFKNNIINGYGKYCSKKNKTYYEGTYLNGKKHGKGSIVSNESVLEGYWEHGEFKFKNVVPYQPM